MRRLFLLFPLLLLLVSSVAQSNIDSLERLVAGAKKDTNTVLTLRKLADAYYYYRPDSAYFFSNLGILMARELSYKKGEIDNTIEMGSSLDQIGNFPEGLSTLLRSLKMSEDASYEDGIENVLNALSVSYAIQKDYVTSKSYSFRGLAIAPHAVRKNYRAIVAENLGITYSETRNYDSALYYLNVANEDFIREKNPTHIAQSRINLADVYVQMNKDTLALINYRSVIPFMMVSKNYEAICSIFCTIAAIFEKERHPDSVLFYGRQSLSIAKTYHFVSPELAATQVLAFYYDSTVRNADSALKYLKAAVSLKDSIFNQEKLKTGQNLTFDESLRQQEIVFQKKRADDNALRTLQLVGIAIFIPIFFLFILFLGKVKVNARVVEFLAIVNLLLFFEFITDLVFPYISDFTNDRPVSEMAILVLIAALLEPLNFNFERWIKKRLVNRSGPKTEKNPTMS
jgi:tetratricopeptide (TPR) repeat protein